MGTMAKRRTAAAATVLFLILYLMQMLATAAPARAVPSDEGNPPSTECATDADDPYQWNLEYWKVQVNDGVPGEIETNVDGAIDLADTGAWTNNNDDPVFRIVMKAGASGSDETFSGLWLTGQGGTIDLQAQGLSHVTFCFTDYVPTDTARLTIRKEVAPQDAPPASFDFKATGQQDFSLGDGESASFVFDVGEGSAGVDVVVSEVTLALGEDWSFYSASCDGDNWVGGYEYVAMTLSADDDVTCTFVNTYTPPVEPSGTIVIRKITQGGTGTFGFDLVEHFEGEVYHKFDLTTTSQGVAVEEVFSGMSTYSWYSVSEDTPLSTGWELTSATCESDMRTSEGQPDPAEFGLADGETVTCTFVNTYTPPEQPSAIVTTECIPGGGTEITVDVENGAMVWIQGPGEGGWFEADGSIVVDWPVGSYDWLALTNQEEFVDEGTIEVVDCSTTTTVEETTTTVAPTLVSITAECPTAGSTPVMNVNPAGGATVNLVDGGDGVFSWTAVAAEGYVIESGATGAFDLKVCADVLGTTIISTTSTTAEVQASTVAAVTASTLPFTGFEMERTLGLALATMMVGAGLLLVAYGTPERKMSTIADRW